MTMRDSTESSEIFRAAIDNPFPRSVDSATIFWDLTPLARKRYDQGTLSPGLTPLNKVFVWTLYNYGALEEDEITDRLNITHENLENLIKQLQGYQYIRQVESPA